jgi:hypothetical protein
VRQRLASRDELCVGNAVAIALCVRVGIDDLEFPKLLDQLGVTPNAIIAWTIDAQTHLRGTLLTPDPLIHAYPDVPVWWG